MSLSERIVLDVESVKNYLRINQDHEDDFLEILIEVAKEKAEAYLQNDFIDDNGEKMDIPFSIVLSCMKMVATWYEIRTANISSHSLNGFSVQVGEIPLDAEELLHPYRKFVGL